MWNTQLQILETEVEIRLEQSNLGGKLTKEVIVKYLYDIGELGVLISIHNKL